MKHIALTLLGCGLLIGVHASVEKVAKAQEEVVALQEPTICDGKVIKIGDVPGAHVLYKAENIHGGRGPSFLVQNVEQRTNKQVIEVRDARCRVIGAFGLFATDYPFGARYYSRTGGSGADSTEWLRLANLAGSNNILVEGVNGTWIRVKNPLNREGSVNR